MKKVNLSVNGKKQQICIISVFTIEDNEYCLYGIPNKDDTYNIKCGKKIEDKVIDIEDTSDKELIESIIKTILYDINKKDYLKLDNLDTFKVKDSEGKERSASLIGQYEIDNNHYILYSVLEDDDKAGIYIKKLLNTGLESITDPEERNIVFTAMREFINSEVGVA
jgi:nucleoid DNA-binding protein